MKRFDINYIYIISTILVIVIFVSLFAIAVTTPSVTDISPTMGVMGAMGAMATPGAMGESVEGTAPPVESRPTFIETPIVIYDMTKSTITPSSQITSVPKMDTGYPTVTGEGPSQGPTMRQVAAGKRIINSAKGMPKTQQPIVNTNQPQKQFEVNYQPGTIITPGMTKQISQPKMQMTGGPRGGRPTLANYLKKSDLQTKNP